VPRFPDYEWDARLGRYRNPATGRVVGLPRVRRALDRAIKSQQTRARTLAAELRNGTITLREWNAGMREVVKNTQLFSAAAGKGGWAQLTASDYGRVGQRVRAQYGYLDQFQAELRAGLGRDGMFSRRSESYAEAGRPLYHEVEREVQREAGKREERSRLSPAEHCLECLTEAARDWQPLGAVVPVGQRICLNGCKCYMEYR